MSYALYYVISFVLCILAFVKYIFTFWARKGIPNVEPSIPLGNFAPLLRGQKSFGTLIRDLYWESVTSSYLGIYFLFRPMILVRDAKIVKRILTTDSEYFRDRRNLFAMHDEEWQILRNKLTPLFTNKKNLEEMFPTLLSQGQILVGHLQSTADKSEIVDMADKILGFSLNTIASIFFGFDDINVFSNPNHRFMHFHKQLGANSMQISLRQIALFLCPEFMSKLNIQACPSDYYQKFIKDIVVNAFEQRKKHGNVRKDFLQLLFMLYKKKEITLDEITAQVFLFYLAGVDTISSTTAFCLYEVCRNAEAMEKLQTEIDQLEEITFETIERMSYMELCIKETMRKFPGLPVLNRETSKDYTIEETGQVIEKGTQILISVLGMQNDSKYFIEPQKFMPERFLDHHIDDAYMPLGYGARACIAAQIGKLAVKVALVTLLSKYDFRAVDNQKMEFASQGVSPLPKCGVSLKITTRIPDNNNVK